MKAEELRIGNIVYWIGENHNKKSECEISGHTLFTMQNSKDYLSMHSPVPITNEWLNDNIGEYKGMIGIYEIDVSNDTFIYIYLYESLLHIALRNRDEDSYRGPIELRPIKYIHELQNLVYVLSGEELKMKKIRRNKNR